MARPSGEKIKNGGRWTQARFNSFIKNNLRQAARKWGPIADCKRNARTRRGFYRCNICKKEVPATVKLGTKRVSNALVDHTDPIIDPKVGFTTWDSVIKGMFCEEGGLQLACKACHDEKTNQERAIAKERNKSG